MEKKGDLLNQLAVISDLLEKTNINSERIAITFTLKSEDFNNVVNEVQKKYGKRIDEVTDEFLMSIGMIDLIFSRNNA